MTEFEVPFKGIPVESALFLLSYPGMLSDEAIAFISEYVFTNDDFNEPQWNAELAYNLTKHNIFFESLNCVEFTDNDKKIFFDIDGSGYIREFIIKDSDNNILITRRLAFNQISQNNHNNTTIRKAI